MYDTRNNGRYLFLWEQPAKEGLAVGDLYKQIVFECGATPNPIAPVFASGFLSVVVRAYVSVVKSWMEQFITLKQLCRRGYFISQRSTASSVINKRVKAISLNRGGTRITSQIHLMTTYLRDTYYV